MDKVTNCEKLVNKKIIQFKEDHPLLDKSIRESLSLLPPPFNMIAQNIYDSFEGSEEERMNKVMMYLNDLKIKGQEHYEIITNKLDSILFGIIDLKDLGVNHTQFLIDIQNTLQINNEQIDGKMEKLKKYVIEIGTNLKTTSNDVTEIKNMLVELLNKGNEDFSNKGIQNELDVDKKIDISEEYLRKIEEQHKEIERLSFELNKYNQKVANTIFYLLKNANAHFYGQKYAEALELYYHILNVNDKNIFALNNIGVLYLTVGQFEEAEKFFTKTLEYDPAHATTLGNMGLLLDTLGLHEKAILWYDKVLHIEPKNARVLYNKGLTHFHQGKYADAIFWYDKALEIDSKFVNALDNKGVAYYQLGLYHDAIEWYDKALEINPKFILALYNKGVACHQLGLYDDAIKWYDKALEIDPKFGMAWYSRGVLLDTLQKYPDAINSYTKAIEINPNHIEALHNKGFSYHNLGDKYEAEKWYDKALEIDPYYVFALYNKIRCVSSLENKTEILDKLELVFQLDPHLKESAKSDAFFDVFKDDTRFLQLVN